MARRKDDRAKADLSAFDQAGARVFDNPLVTEVSDSYLEYAFSVEHYIRFVTEFDEQTLFEDLTRNEHARMIDAAYSEDGLAFCRRLAKKQYTYPNDELAMELLLERWNLGLGKTPAERRIALRQSRQDELLCAATDGPQDEVERLPSLQQALPDEVTGARRVDDPDCHPLGPPTDDECGDDDRSDNPDDFYATAWEDA